MNKLLKNTNDPTLKEKFHAVSTSLQQKNALQQLLSQALSGKGYMKYPKGAINLLVKYYKLTILGALFALYLLYKWYRDKQIEIYCQKTNRNVKILKTLNRLTKRYSPTWWLPGPLSKILFYGIRPKTRDKAYYQTEEMVMDDGEVIAVDFYPRRHREILPKDAPTLILMPGIFGESTDPWCRELCYTADERGGWRVVIINRRGFGNMPIRGEYLTGYHTIEDIKVVVDNVAKLFPTSKRYLLGISMGAGQITNYLQKYGEECGVEAGCAIASTWNLDRTFKYVNNSFIMGNFLVIEGFQTVKNHLHEPKFLELMKKKGISEGSLPNFYSIRYNFCFFGNFCFFQDFEIFLNLLIFRAIKELQVANRVWYLAAFAGRRVQ